MKKSAIFIVLSFAMLLGPSVLATAPQVSPSDNAYHYAYFQDGRQDPFYLEWWYFNFFSENLQVIFAYLIINPDDIKGFGMTGVSAVAYTPEGIVKAEDFFPPNQFEASYDVADVIIPNTGSTPNRIIVNGDGSYRIVGDIQEGSHQISWDLTYRERTNPWLAGDRVKVGIFPWEVMSWLVYMPGASVTGEVIIDGATYEIDDVPGYHDHNWGEWIPTNVLWNWAQCYDPEQSITFQIGDFRFKPVGLVSIEVENERIVFEKDEYSLTHRMWQYDPDNKKYFPVESWLYAENEKGRLIVSFKTIDTEVLFSPLKMPALLPDVILYEQTAHYEGRFWKRNNLDEWELSISFSGRGFKEYSTLMIDRSFQSGFLDENLWNR